MTEALRQSPLREVHKGLGASLGVFQGWEVPESYGDPAAEYRALREGAGLADWSHAGLLAFSGEDRVKFLQGLVTSDVRALQPGSAQPSLVLTPKGKLVGDFFLYNRGADLLAVATPLAARGVLKALSRYQVLSQTSIAEESRERLALLLIGPAARRAVLAALGRDVEDRDYAAAALGPAVQQTAEVLRYPPWGPESLLLTAPLGAGPALWRELTAPPAGARPVGRHAWETVRIESGTPLFGTDMDEDTLPLEAGLEPAISFTKGCYMGQETTSRIHHVGHVNRRLVALKCSRLPSPGTELRAAGALIGRVTSAVDSPRLGAAVALAMARAEHAAPGSSLELDGPGGLQAAEVIALPLIGA